MKLKIKEGFLLAVLLTLIAASWTLHAQSKGGSRLVYGGGGSVEIECFPHPNLSHASLCQALVDHGNPSSYNWGAQGSASLLFTYADVAEIACEPASSLIPVVYVSVRFLDGSTSDTVLDWANCSGP